MGSATSGTLITAGRISHLLARGSRAILKSTFLAYQSERNLKKRSTHSSLFSLLILLNLVVISYSWHSQLYPKEWRPGSKDSHGRFLHDFSYAGYHAGEKDSSAGSNEWKLLVDVTAGPYNADNSGGTDSTQAIQKAIDDVSASPSGGIVYLPRGRYKVGPQKSGDDYALLISHSNTVIQGDGVGRTFIYNSDSFMREKAVIWIKPEQADFRRSIWYKPDSKSDFGEIYIAKDIDYPTQTIPLELMPEADELEIGDWIVIRSDCTEEFIAEHRMSGRWENTLKGVAYYRQVISLDRQSKTVKIHIPTRYYLKTRDNARIYRVIPHVSEIGLRDFSIGMKESPMKNIGTMDHTEEHTAGYQAHHSYLIRFDHSVNCWVKRVHSYKPGVNEQAHMLSNGILLNESQHITVEDCVIGNPQYRGGGGNGNCYIFSGGDCLVNRCTAQRGRHNYTFNSMRTSGNVILDSKSVDGLLAVDFHRHLSMANLIDNMHLDADYISAKYRPYGDVLHGHTTTESVIWNTRSSLRSPIFIIVSSQWKWGYVIGTRGLKTLVYSGVTQKSGPEDFVEGIGMGDFLIPRSLYKDQLRRRLITLNLP